MIFQRLTTKSRGEQYIIMRIESLIKEFICDCEYKQLAKNTIKSYSRVLNHFVSNIPIDNIEDLNKQLIKSYISNLTLAISSKNQYLRCIMSFLHWYEEEYDTSLGGIHIKRLREQHKVLYTPSEEEVKKLINFYNNKSYMSCRNRTIISVFINTGIRLNELLELKVEDIDLNNKVLTVNRKGGYLQQLVLNSSVLLQLTRFINRYVSNSNNKLLFVSKNGKRLNPNDIHYILKKVDKNITPHSLRRYFASSLLITKGVPLIYVSRMLGHKDIQLTNKYYLQIESTDIKDYFN